MRTAPAPEKGYVRRTTVKVPMDIEAFEDLFSGVSRHRRRFNVTAEDLDDLLPHGWSERSFRTTTKCVVSRDQPITIRYANQRKLQYDHSECPRCQWCGEGEKPALCQPKKTWPVDMGYLFMTFSRERTHQEQAKEGESSIFVTFVPNQILLRVPRPVFTTKFLMIMILFVQQSNLTCPG